MNIDKNKLSDVNYGNEIAKLLKIIYVNKKIKDIKYNSLTQDFDIILSNNKVLDVTTIDEQTIAEQIEFNNQMADLEKSFAEYINSICNELNKKDKQKINFLKKLKNLFTNK